MIAKRSILGLAIAALSFSVLRATAETATADPKKVKFCDKDYDLDKREVYFAFGNGKELVLDLNKVPEETRMQLTCHGASQKVGDSFAGVKGDFVQGIQNAEDTIEQLYAGVWKADREGDARPRLAELAEAVARIRSVPLEMATAAVEKGTDEQRKTWRSNAKVKSVIATIRAEKAAAALEAAGEQRLEIDLG